MHGDYEWLPADELDHRLESNVAVELIKLARSTDPKKTDDLIDHRDRHDPGQAEHPHRGP